MIAPNLKMLSEYAWRDERKLFRRQGPARAQLRYVEAENLA